MGQTPPRRAAEANVACPPFIQTDPLTRYGFARANLAALWHARNSVKDALAELKETQKPDVDPFTTLTAMLRSAKVSTNDFICAKQVLEKYTSPKTHLKDATAEQQDTINTAAKFAVMVYDQQIDVNRRMIEIIKKMPDTVNTVELSDQMSSLQVERGQRWADLVTPTSMALMLLIDPRPTDEDGNFIQSADPKVGKVKRLIVTQDQKNEMLTWLDENFPELKDGTSRDQISDPAKTAQMYLTVFKGRKCSDE